MARAKFKLGTLVEIGTGEDNQDIEFGVVTAVITTREGYAYKVDENEVKEDQILNGYRPIVARQVKKSAPKKNAKTAAKQATKKAPEAEAEAVSVQ